MKTLLTPKELADAIGASESSLRRWVDNGRIRMSRTVGGHRRIPVDEAIRFIRESGSTLLHPQMLGLDESLKNVADHAPGGSEEDQFFHALSNGDRRIARWLVESWYLDGRPMAELFDGPIRAAMHRLGELWNHSPRGILIEHRATEICLDVLRELRSMLPLPRPDAPVALGAAPAGDPYLLPSLMASLICADAGFREINYGANMPLPLLAEAAAEHDARVVWISLSAPIAAPDELRDAIAQLASELRPRNTRLAVGGRHANEVISPAVEASANVRIVASMQELSTFARESV